LLILQFYIKLEEKCKALEEEKLQAEARKRASLLLFILWYCLNIGVMYGRTYYRRRRARDIRRAAERAASEAAGRAVSTAREHAAVSTTHEHAAPPTG
jgi:uncharacterized membrane protein